MTSMKMPNDYQAIEQAIGSRVMNILGESWTQVQQVGT